MPKSKPQTNRLDIENFRGFCNIVFYPRIAVIALWIIPGLFSPATIRFSLPRSQVVTPNMVPHPIQIHSGTVGGVSPARGNTKYMSSMAAANAKPFTGLQEY